LRICNTHWTAPDLRRFSSCSVPRLKPVTYCPEGRRDHVKARGWIEEMYRSASTIRPTDLDNTRAVYELIDRSAEISGPTWIPVPCESKISPMFGEPLL